MINLYSIHDRTEERFSPLFPADNDGIAQRRLIQTLTSPNAERMSLRQFPADFMLMQLGTFDEKSGHIEGCVPRPVTSVESVVLTLSSVPSDAQPAGPK